MRKTDRLIERLTGYEQAKAYVAGYVLRFNQCNPDNSMAINTPSGLSADDMEGSGEFVAARCTNINEASSNAEEVYEIYVPW
jgi:hypothetical protein